MDQEIRRAGPSTSYRKTIESSSNKYFTVILATQKSTLKCARGLQMVLRDVSKPHHMPSRNVFGFSQKDLAQRFPLAAKNAAPNIRNILAGCM
jgi:hypothetical protein